MGARPSVWLLTAALLLAAGGVLWLGLRPEPPASGEAGGSGPATAEARERLEASSSSAPSPRSASPGGRSRSTSVESTVPHEVVLRAGGGPETGESEDHRLFVLAVDPHLPTRELERLLKELRARHADAAVLDVRVYDSAELAAPDRARYRRDGGARRDRHRVAEMRRNERLGLDVVRIRGVEVEL